MAETGLRRESLAFPACPELEACGSAIPKSASAPFTRPLLRDCLLLPLHRLWVLPAASAFPSITDILILSLTVGVLSYRTITCRNFWFLYSLIFFN